MIKRKNSQNIIIIFKNILILFLCIELISLILLVTLRLYNFSFSKIKNSEPLIVYFSKKHLPHPIFRQPVSKDYNKEIFDPNTGIYNHKFNRFGEEKKINLINEKDDSYNIFLIGGSTVEGHGVYESQHTIHSSIQESINLLNCSNKINVYNEGISGNTSKTDFLNISLRIIPHYKPDMMISLQGWNDFLAYAGSRNNKISPLSQYWTTREQKMYSYINKENYSSEFLNVIKNKTYLGILLSSMIGTYKRYYFIDLHYRVELSKNEDIQILRKNYFYFQEQSQKISELNGVDYYHFFQPSLIYKKSLTEYEKNILNGAKNTFSFGKRNNYIFSSEFWNNLKNFNETIINDNEFTEKKWIYDLSHAFENSSDIDYLDHGHLSKIAQKKLGKLIFGKIKDKIPCNYN